jgi:L-alanine-DL-glutamate epimerase-like enolase superfamily enzyme
MAGVFRIAHGARTEARVVVAELADGQGAVGRGECVPYARYRETAETVRAQIEAVRGALEAGVDREALQQLMPPGAARNAVDCALWDLEAKQTGVPVWQRAGLPPPRPLTTAYTIVIDEPEAMADAARAAAGRPLLKVKLGGGGDLARVRAVSDARPDARLIVDGNEGMDAASLPALLEAARDLRIEVIEQPLPAASPVALTRFAAPVAVCADESFHTSADIDTIVQGYDAINIKLDKTGGLTEALKAVRLARAAGLKVMVGCMVGTSLAMAPAVLLAQLADWVDLDGPLLLDKDREPGLSYVLSTVWPPDPALWG